MAEYTKEFLDFWTVYGPPKNASKKDAFKAWNQVAKARPGQELMLACASAYNLWLASEHAQNGKGYPAKKHPATWLRGECWDGFLEDAGKAVGAVPVPEPESRSWLDGPFQTLKTALIAENRDWSPGAIYENWFRRTVFVDGNPVEIRCPSEFHKTALSQRFGDVIKKAFGHDTRLTVAGKN